MIEAYTNFQKSTRNFDINLYGNNVGEHIYNEIMKIV